MPTATLSSTSIFIVGLLRDTASWLPARDDLHQEIGARPRQGPPAKAYAHPWHGLCSRDGVDAPPILALEDEPDDLRFIRRALKRADLSNPLLTATTVEQAQKLCTSSTHPVLVLVDVYLGGRSGLDFLEWLRSQPQPLGDTPAVIFTVSTDRAHERRAIALGSALFLGKPATEDVLADAIVAFGLVKTTVVRGREQRRWLARRLDDGND